MLVQAINYTNNMSFGQKRYLDKQTYGYLRELLPKINQRTVYVSNDTSYKSSYLKELQVDDFTLIDGRTLLKQVPEEEQFQKETLIGWGKTHLVINNKDGEIVDYSKPMFESWDKIFAKISKCIKLIVDNFDDFKIVKKTRLKIGGLTIEGKKKQNELEETFAELESAMTVYE